MKKIITREALSRIEERNKLLTQQNWVVENIFEKGEIHHLCGPSGVGKSTWFYQLMWDVSQGVKIFGKFQSHPEPFVYIVCDRSFLLTSMTLKRIGLGNWDLPFFTIDEVRRELNKKEVTLGDISDLVPWAKILYIDAIGWFEPAKATKGMGYAQAMNYWSEIRDRVTSKGKTIIATGHSPKAKGNERYGNPRDRVMGTTGTVGSIATVINFEFGNEENVSDPHRILNVSPRNYPGFVYKYKLDGNGCFVYTDVFEGSEAEGQKAEYVILKEMKKNGSKPGDLIIGETIKGWMERFNISRATMTRVLGIFVESGFVVRIRKGVYRIAATVPDIKEQ